MNEFFNNDFDPYEKLLLCENNIQQCALAINTGSDLMKALNEQQTHQRELITQLLVDNLKLQHELNLVKLSIEELKK